MIWSLYAMLGQNMWFQDHPELDFDDAAWDKLLEEAVQYGFNQIVLDLGEGVQYQTHPELARKGAWSTDRVRAEVKRCRDLGIALIPKLNFSATHHLWLGEYRRMMSTKIYYDVCRDLIGEVWELFEHPEYIHLGMDEEGDPQFFAQLDMVHYRQGELIWHDLKYLCDCVLKCGAKPWIWGDMCVYHPEEFRKRIPYTDVVLSPWIYFSIRREHWTLVASKQRYIDSNEGKMGLTYMEEAPIWQAMTHEGVKAANDGYATVPCASIWGECEYCNDDVVEHFVNNCDPKNLIGFMTAPWVRTNMKNIDNIKQSIKALAAAREKFVKE
jgi:hypothetical protein